MRGNSNQASRNEMFAKKQDLKKKVVWMYGEGLIPISQKDAKIKAIDSVNDIDDLKWMEKLIGGGR